MAAVETERIGRVCAAICLLSVCSLCRGHTQDRQVLIELNPGSPSPPPGDLLHARAVGDNDTLHFLFCSQGAPTLLLVHTNTSFSTVKVNWTQFNNRTHSGGLTVEPESSILYSTAVVFNRLLEYDDVNDTADPTSDLFPPYDLQDFRWSRLNLSGLTALLCGNTAASSNGSLCLQLSLFETEGRGQHWPRLLHTANSSQLRVWLDGVLPRATRSRFLLELQSVGGASPLSRVEVHRSIDDEFTPSIFKVSQWTSALNNSSDVLGFVQWKPVAYRQADPALEDAAPCRHSEPRPQSGEAVAAVSGLIRAFYKEPEATGLNVSFGLAGDPFYNSTKFLSWTLLVGVGSPPVDSFSPLVIGMMAVGLGTPMILLLLGGICVCTRKRAVATAYEPIN
ncbi:Glycosylated lysosomal membrane protein [Larimichthys crocea]|uniref:Glycosylated lysosomal membrane protein n=1 Tax=Larimichthys crocea TaxID=215358 RepID=A0A6G0HU72_LARCR|nr:glycosylated lysosomal membrane protein isoform X2 [Larimichthys crocea]KAE8282613.1 Glycosylated lysosomal membrane protein [Larimichthys crocea]